jgi:hypothetical protein
MRGLDINRISKFNWPRIPSTIWFIVLFVCSRIPMLFFGFGLDPDAWRIANSAFDLRHHLAYHASRFPGYPLPEFINALVIDLGWSATNGLTMLLSLLSVLAFGCILKKSDCKDKGFLLLAYAFMPLLWINSTNSMDYMWSLSFIIFTWLFILKDRYFSAGLMLALAAGSRATAAVYVIPFLFLVHSRNASGKSMAKFMLTFVVASILIFMPLYVIYGLSFIRHYPAHTNIIYVGYQALKSSGLPSLILLSIVLMMTARNLPRLFAVYDKNDIFVLLSVATALVIFFLAPYHIEYLIASIPFGLLLIRRTAKRYIFVVLCCALILHSFVNLGSIQHTGDGNLKFRAVDAGAVWKNIAARKAQLAYARKLANIDLPDHSVVIAGTGLPILAYLDEDVSSSMDVKRMFDSNRPREGVWDFHKNIWFRYLIDLDELRQLQRDDYLIFYLQGIRAFTLETHCYDLNDHGAIFLEIR